MEKTALYFKNLSEIVLKSSYISYDDTKGQKIVNTINPHSFCASLEDPEFRRSLLESNILTADGIGIVYGIKLLFNKNLKELQALKYMRHF